MSDLDAYLALVGRAVDGRSAEHRLVDEILRLRAVVATLCEHDSLTGIDRAEGPDKVWRCDVCGLHVRHEPDPDHPGAVREVVVDRLPDPSTKPRR